MQQEGGGSQSEDEATWGQRPAKVCGSGLATPLRKFTACQRKYLALYLQLLARQGGINTLLAAHAGLAALPDARVMADLARHACPFFSLSTLDVTRHCNCGHTELASAIPASRHGAGHACNVLSVAGLSICMHEGDAAACMLYTQKLLLDCTTQGGVSLSAAAAAAAGGRWGTLWRRLRLRCSRRLGR